VGAPLICVIEDEEVIAGAVAARLRAEGFAVEVAGDGPGGVALCGRMRPDAVVLDLLDRSSRDLCERVRTASPETKVILWARDEDELEILDPGSTTPRRLFTAVPEELRSELSTVRLNRVEE
jgi:DNA-binding response OmpR family regulator